jgi:hypothetical protein
MNRFKTISLAAILSASFAGLAMAETTASIPGPDSDIYATDIRVSSPIATPTAADTAITASQPGRDSDVAGTDMGGGVLPADSANPNNVRMDVPGRDTDSIAG